MKLSPTRASDLRSSRGNLIHASHRSMRKLDDIKWESVLACREFWLIYYGLALDWESHSGRKKWRITANDERVMSALRELLRDREIRIDLPDGYSLVITLETGTSHRLFLLHGRKRQLLGWVDAHFHPDVFRWGEFQQIVAAARSIASATLASPIFLLLYMYVGISRSDKLSQIRSVFNRELRTLACLSPLDRRLFTESCVDREYIELEWTTDAKRGWIAEGGYSLRAINPDQKFDFAGFAKFIRVYGEA